MGTFCRVATKLCTHPISILRKVMMKQKIIPEMPLELDKNAGTFYFSLLRGTLKPQECKNKMKTGCHKHPKNDCKFDGNSKKKNPDFQAIA